MKAKRKNFGSFFARIGAGFLAFWLVVMGAFTLLMGQQRAKLMLSEMENSCIRLSQISDGTAVGSAFPRGAALAGFGCGAGAGVAAGRACCMLAAMRLTGWVS